MKNRILIIVATLMLGLVCAAQEREVTKFLGIPVDGTKSEMIQKLKAKGFTPTKADRNILEGEFNGRDVYVHVVTNNRKVCRIMLADVNHVDEADIKIRFNNLARQFANNPNYAGSDEQVIPDDDDISYEMSVNNKRYEAVFHQVGSEFSDSSMTEKAQSLLAVFSREEIQDSTPEAKEKLEQAKYRGLLELLSLRLNRPVWFLISESYGKYYICMFYDNEYNKADGEDL